MDLVSSFYTVTNLVGLYFYVVFVRAIQSRMLMEERGPDFGDSLNFMFTALPILLFCLVLNIVWGIQSRLRVSRRRDYRLAIAWVVISVTWVGTILFIRNLA